MSYKLKPIPDNAEPRSCKGTLASRTSCGSPAVFDWTGPLKTNSRPMCLACTIVSLHNEMWAMQDNLEEQIGDSDPTDRIDDLQAEVAALKQERKALDKKTIGSPEDECENLMLYLQHNFPEELEHQKSIFDCVTSLLYRYKKDLDDAQRQLNKIRDLIDDEED